MMIDTIRVVSPDLSEFEISGINAHLSNVHPQQRRARDGGIIETYDRGVLVGPLGVTIRVEIHRRRSTCVSPSSNEIARGLRSGRHPRTWHAYRDSAPFVLVEASVHKALLGHNVIGGPRSFLPSVSWLIDEIGLRCDVPLPAAPTWELVRIDAANVFELKPAAVSAIALASGTLTRGRAEVTSYGETGASSKGSMTTLKVYGKGAELLRRDEKRLKRILPAKEFEAIRAMAKRILRVESTIWARGLRNALALRCNPRVGEVTDATIATIHNENVNRFLREGTFGKCPVVRRPDTVEARLNDVYSQGRAKRLLDTWRRLVEVGPAILRIDMRDSTYYNDLKCLRTAGCAWLGADLDPARCVVPEGFMLHPSDPRCCKVEDPSVIEQLAPYRLVAANGALSGDFTAIIDAAENPRQVSECLFEVNPGKPSNGGCEQAHVEALRPSASNGVIAISPTDYSNDSSAKRPRGLPLTAREW